MELFDSSHVWAKKIEGIRDSFGVFVQICRQKCHNVVENALVAYLIIAMLLRVPIIIKQWLLDILHSLVKSLLVCCRDKALEGEAFEEQEHLSACRFSPVKNVQFESSKQEAKNAMGQ